VDRHGLEKLVHRELLPLREISLGTADLRRAGAHRHRVVQVDVAALHRFHHEEHRHDLRDAGGRVGLVGVLLEEHALAGGLFQDRDRGLDVEASRPGRRQRRRGADVRCRGDLLRERGPCGSSRGAAGGGGAGRSGR
jgi:hypothetical protein